MDRKQWTGFFAIWAIGPPAGIFVADKISELGYMIASGPDWENPTTPPAYLLMWLIVTAIYPYMISILMRRNRKFHGADTTESIDKEDSET